MTESRTLKACRRCGNDKPLAGFCRNSRTSDGLQSYCKECMKAAQRKTYQKDPAKNIAKNREWRRRNRDHHNARHREYEAARRARMPEGAKEAVRKKDRVKCRLWSRANPEKRRAIGHAYRARVRGGGGRYTSQEWHGLRECHGNRCLRCGGSGPLSPDHVIPVSKGGANTIDNIQPLCRPCNKKKGAKAADYRPHSRAGGVRL